MDNYQKLLEKVKKINNPLKRKIFFLGVLTKALKKGKPVLVGGCALEFYSTGGYNTGDIDLIYPDIGLVGKHLKKWGFQKKGRHWINKELDIFIEVPGSDISEEEEQRITVIEVENLKVYLLGIEDLIIDRLNAFVHWKSTDDGYWAKELIFIYGEKLDTEYLRERATEEDTLKALEILMEEVEEIKNEKL